MALIPCKECKKKISEEAASCPHCGAPVTLEWVQKQKKNRSAGLKGCFTLVAIVMLFGFIASLQDDKKRSPTRETQETVYNLTYKTINVRLTADKGAPIVGQLKHQGTAERSGVEGNWTKVRFKTEAGEDKVGYVFSKLLSDQEGHKAWEEEVKGRAEAVAKKMCAENAGCTLQESGKKSEAEFTCMNLVEKAATYEHERVSFMKQNFDRYGWQKKGRILTMLGDNLKLQNGFGAYSQHKYACSFDLQTNIVQLIGVEQGSW